MDFEQIAPGWYRATIDGRQWYGRSATEIVILALDSRSKYFNDHRHPARSRDDELSPSRPSLRLR